MYFVVGKILLQILDISKNIKENSMHINAQFV